MPRDSDNPSMRPRLHSGLSQHVVPPDIAKVADILGRTIMRVEDLERWRERRRDQYVDIEHRITQLETKREIDEKEGNTKEVKLANALADLKLQIELVRASVKSIMTTAIVAWALVTAAGGILLHFWK